MRCCCSAGEKLLLFITINTAMSRFNWCLKALCCTFRLTKQTLLWIALSLWGQLSPSPLLGAESSHAPLQSPSLSRQGDLGSLLPFGMEIKDHQKKGNGRKTWIPSWVSEESPAGLVRVLEDTCQEQQECLGVQSSFHGVRDKAREGKWDESSRKCLNGLGLQLELS